MKIDGLDELINKLETMHDDIDDDVDTILKMNAYEGQEKAVKIAKEVMNKGYWTGNLARGINVSSEKALTYTITSNAGYSGFLEFGTRYMEAAPFIFPMHQALKEQVYKDLNRLLNG
ncbi:HK97-gp10 family putative phage morphogenesis protein [Mammaliicoccus sciuri]|uniref:HK97-gp10 family putative phage morphogenesis protein n=1 Tax=Mammaliicoccus sciuri TaxID=1296 RepID=UPI0037C967BE